MATAFQPNAFQPDGFQEHGGVATSDIQIAINATQDGDSGLLTVNVTPVAAPVTEIPGGGWYIPDRRRRKKREEEPAEVTDLPEVVEESPEEIAARLATRVALEKARRRDARVMAELRALYAEQDRLAREAAGLEARIAEQEADEDLILILSLA